MNAFYLQTMRSSTHFASSVTRLASWIHVSGISSLPCLPFMSIQVALTTELAASLWSPHSDPCTAAPFHNPCRIHSILIPTIPRLSNGSDAQAGAIHRHYHRLHHHQPRPISQPDSPPDSSSASSPPPAHSPRDCSVVSCGGWRR